MDSFKEQIQDIPLYVDWNNFHIDNMNASVLILYVHNLDRNIESDINKLNVLKNMPNLSTLDICSDDFDIGIYMSELLKPLSARGRRFNLLDDFKNKDRSYIDETKLADGTRLSYVPNAYIQWNSSHRKMLSYGFRLNDDVPVSLRDTADLSRNHPTDKALEKIEEILDEFSQIPNLTFIDKVVLVSNYLQRTVQFVAGKTTDAEDGVYDCVDFDYEKYKGIDTVDNVIFDNIGKCNCISRTMMLMLNNPRMNVNCRIANDNSAPHAYCYVYDDETDRLYCIDPSWCISRNPNRFENTLKASSFSDEFLLIGQDKLSTMPFHNTSNCFPHPLSQESLDRNLIQESVEKLKRYGIPFDYPMEFPLSSIKTDRQIEKNITP